MISVLAIFDLEKEITLKIDALDYIIGACIN
jgi:hypothetical protein